MTEPRITLTDIMEARRLMLEDSPKTPRYILSSVEALRWCHLTDHNLKVCVSCRNDEAGIRGILAAAPPSKKVTP
jgi:hypothetical protein